jgi:hypothetical protein
VVVGVVVLGVTVRVPVVVAAGRAVVGDMVVVVVDLVTPPDPVVTLPVVADVGAAALVPEGVPGLPPLVVADVVA